MLPALIPIFKIVASMIAQKALSNKANAQESEDESTGPVGPSVQTGVENLVQPARQTGFNQGLGLFR